MRGLLTLICVAVLTGPLCAQDPTKDQALYPLRKGNKWTYKSGSDTVEVLVKGTEKVGMEDQFELLTSLNGSPVASETIAIRKDGLYRVKVGKDEVKPPMLFLKFGGKKGDSWMVGSAIGQADNLTGKFTLGETEVEWNKEKEKRKAVTVSGPEMTANGQKLAVSYTFLENVGIFEQSMSLGGIQVKLVLTKYEPSKE